MAETSGVGFDALLDKFGLHDSHIYIVTALFLALLGTGLLLAHRIGEQSWVGLIEWVFASVCGGGGISAYRK